MRSGNIINIVDSLIYKKFAKIKINLEDSYMLDEHIATQSTERNTIIIEVNSNDDDKMEKIKEKGLYPYIFIARDMILNKRKEELHDFVIHLIEYLLNSDEFDRLKEWCSYKHQPYEYILQYKYANMNKYLEFWYSQYLVGLPINCYHYREDTHYSPYEYHETENVLSGICYNTYTDSICKYIGSNSQKIELPEYIKNLILENSKFIDNREEI